MLRLKIVLSLLSGIILLDASAYAQAIRTQTIGLVPGWNAVHLEVDPVESDISAVFKDLPVDIVTSYTAPRSGAQFILDPSANMQGAYGWSVWYAPERSDSFLTTLNGLNGAQCYLIHSQTNLTLSIEGQVPVVNRKWIPNAFNLVGFTVQGSGAPTYEQFFSSSSAHNHNKIYRLNNGAWRQVLDPGVEAMRSGEAFWIFSEGPSSYTGPLEVDTESVLGVLLRYQGSDDIVFRNHTDHPVSFVVDHIPQGNSSIPMAAVIRAYDTDLKILRDLNVNFENGPWTQELPSLEAGKAIRLPLALQADKAIPGVHYSLLRIQSDMGTEEFLTVTADLEGDE